MILDYQTFEPKGFAFEPTGPKTYGFELQTLNFRNHNQGCLRNLATIPLTGVLGNLYETSFGGCDSTGADSLRRQLLYRFSLGSRVSHGSRSSL